MADLGAPWDAVQTAQFDQAAATMADLGRGWAAMYRALIENGIPPRMARRIVERQHTTACRSQLVSLELAARR